MSNQNTNESGAFIEAVASGLAAVILAGTSVGLLERALHADSDEKFKGMVAALFLAAAAALASSLMGYRSRFAAFTLRAPAFLITVVFALNYSSWPRAASVVAALALVVALGSLVLREIASAEEARVSHLE